MGKFKKYNLSYCFILLFSVLAMNCGKSYPKCSDGESLNLVKEIIKNNGKSFGLRGDFLNYSHPKNLRIEDISIQAIRMVGIDKEFGIPKCEAEYSYAIKGKSKSDYIKYELQNTEDGYLHVSAKRR